MQAVRRALSAYRAEGKMKTTTFIVIPDAELEELNSFLRDTKRVDGYDDIIKVYSKDLGSGYEVDIKVCNSDDGAFVDPVLFLNGSEACVGPVGDQLDGQYRFEDAGNEFSVIVKGA